MWKRKLNLLPGYLLDPIRRVNTLIPGWKKHIIENLSIPQRDINNLFEKCQVLDFTNEEEIYGKKILNKFGLKDKDKFVCLAVRDEAYQLKKIPARHRDWSYHDHRHTDVDKFMLAAEELAKRGYFVFRMGVVVEKPFNSKNSKIIDYANSNLRSDFMDVYLGAKCSFCISTGFGFEDLPCIFRKPLVQLLQPFGWAYTHNEKYLLMTKHHVLKKEKRRLTLSEIFSHGVAYAWNSKTFEQKGIELVDNTPEEIKDLVIEMVENLEFKRKLNSEDAELQKTFKNLLASSIRRYRHAEEAYHGEIRSRFSTRFLRENKNWLK
jgi:putative glycosyltransferase (TIGR04372 family)